MKKGGVYLLIVILSVISISSISAVCDLRVTLVNQDPFPAQPNTNVELVFQVSGVDNEECGPTTFEIIESYPFTLIEGEALRALSGNTYVRSQKTDWILPYNLKVDENALDGKSEIEVEYITEIGATQFKQSKIFEVDIEDSIAEFEVYVKDYSYQTKEITFEILNIAKADVEALTLEIPQQDKIEIRGSNRVVIGDLDSNEYSSADFKASVSDGEIDILVIYTDQVGVRRTINKQVIFNSNYFIGQSGDSGNVSFIYSLILIVAVALIIWWIFRKRKSKKESLMRRKRGIAKL